MSIRDWGVKIKQYGYFMKSRLPQGETATRYYTGAIIILVGFSSFGLGRLSALDEKQTPIVIENETKNDDETPLPAEGGGTAQLQTASIVQSVSSGGKLVASRNGTKYYFPWCGGASKIADTNKIWFNSVADAKAKGYSAAGNCKGLK